jgi:hypothetical protein
MIYFGLKTRIFLIVYNWLILLLLLLLLNIAWLEKFTLCSRLTCNNLCALMIIFKPVFETNFFAALWTCDTIDGCKLSIAFVSHALLVGFVLCLFGDALSTNGVSIPNSIRVLFKLHFDSLFAYRAYYHVNAIVVTGQRALMVVRSHVISAKDLLAAIALKGQKVLLLAHWEAAVLTNVSKFHYNTYFFYY